MVKAMLQAVAIQKRRVLAGKRGYAKAVRRFYARIDRSAKADSSLPVNWLRPEKQAAA